MVTLAILVYVPTLRNGFVNWDDDLYVLDNPLIRRLSLENLATMFVEPYAGLYQPLTLLSLGLNYWAGGLDPMGYHLVNLILHAANTALVLLWIYRLTHVPGLAVITSLLFAVHPMQVESVAWVTERKDVLYGFFFLLSLISYTRYANSGGSRFYVGALLLFALALMSKALAVTLAVVIVAVDLLSGRRIADKRLILEKFPFFALAIGFGVVAILAQTEAGAVAQMGDFRLAERLALSGHALVAYTSKLALPVRLSAFYPYPTSSGGTIAWYVWLSPIGVAALAALFVFTLRKAQAAAFGIAFFLVVLAPALQILPAGPVFIADRFTYLPSVGMFLAVAVGLLSLSDSRRAPRLVVLAVLTVWLGALSIMTLGRTRVWRSGLTLWNDVLDKHSNAAIAYNNRGSARLQLGDARGAIVDFNEAIALRGDYAKAYNNRGAALTQLGQYDAALKDHTRAIELNPEYADAYYNRGLARDYLGSPTAALQDYDRAIDLDATVAEMYYSRAGARANVGNLDGALQDYSESLRLQPNDPKTLANRGIVLFALGDRDRACIDWQAAGQLRHEEAIARFREHCQRER